jgi:hypothetical protein
MCGWPDDFRDVGMELDRYVREGTELHILSEKPMEGPNGRLRVLNSPQWKPKNLKLKHEVGKRTNICRLATLPVQRAAAILVLAQASQNGDEENDASISDAETVACATMVQLLCEGRYDAVEGETPDERRRPRRIVCEVLDPRTDRILNRNQELRNTITFFRSNALETGLFAMAYSEPTIFNTLVLLLSPLHEVGKLVSERPSKYAKEADFRKPSETENGGCHAAVNFSFWELHERVRSESGGLLIGWYRHTQDHPSGSTSLGPSIDRHEQYLLTSRDRLIVLSPLTKDPRAKAQEAKAQHHSPGLGDQSASAALDGFPGKIKVSVTAVQGGKEQLLGASEIQLALPSEMGDDQSNQPQITAQTTLLHLKTKTPYSLLDEAAAETSVLAQALSCDVTPAFKNAHVRNSSPLTVGSASSAGAEPEPTVKADTPAAQDAPTALANDA